MEVLKNISFSIALFLIGAIFVFFGLSGGFVLKSYSFMLNDIWARILSTFIGIVLVSFALYIEIRLKTISIGKTDAKKSDKNVLTGTKQTSMQTQDFFFTLDDKQAENFPVMIKDSICVQILARTIVNLLSQYEKTFEQIGREGCEIKFLFVDPSSDASKFLYGSDSEVYRSNIILAAQHIKKLKHILGARLQVRVIKHAPTVSAIIIQKQELTKSFMQVQLYFLHSAVGRDRPIFRVQYGDKWYKVFEDEFNQLWTDSAEWDINCVS